MATYTFHVKEHSEFGTLGFSPTWYPQGDPLGGMGVAHDILEHFPNDCGDAEGEFMALGCAFRLRGETGYMQRNGSTARLEQYFSADFPDIFRITLEQRGHTRIRPCPHGVRIDSDVKDQLYQIVREGRALLLREFRVRWLHREDQIHVLNWLCYGYTQAGKRYGRPSLTKRGISFHEIAFTVFHKIESEADKLLSFAEEGQVLKVIISLKSLEAKLSLTWPKEY